MGCGCGKNRQQHEVVVDDRVVYISTSEHTAKAVAKRYPGSTVRPKGAATAQPATADAPATPAAPAVDQAVQQAR